MVNHIHKPGSNNIGTNTGQVYGKVENVNMESVEADSIKTEATNMLVGDNTICISIHLPNDVNACIASIDKLMDRIEGLVEKSGENKVNLVVEHPRRIEK